MSSLRTSALSPFRAQLVGYLKNPLWLLRVGVNLRCHEPNVSTHDHPHATSRHGEFKAISQVLRRSVLDMDHAPRGGGGELG